jgi:hypothetical protein
VTDSKRSLREHLSDARLYEAGAPAAFGSQWRLRLLAARFGPARRRREAPRTGMPPLMRLVLEVAVPVAVIVLIGIGAYLRPDLSLRWPDFMPRLDPGGISALRILEWHPREPALLARLGYFKYLLWPLLVGLSALFTFLARRRAPRILPLDW